VKNARRSPLFWGLLVLLGAEFVLMALLVVVLVIELLIDTPVSFASAVALTVIAGIAAVWLGVIIVGALRGHAWIRGAAIVWQVLQFAVGIGSLQGLFAQPAYGWPLILVAVAAFLLLVSKPVVQATSIREGTDESP